MDLFFQNILPAKTNKEAATLTHQAGEAMSRVTASVKGFFREMTTNFAGTGILKIDSFVTLLGSPPISLEHSYLILSSFLKMNSQHRYKNFDCTRR